MDTKCIPAEKVCDGIKDCPNKDDESETRCRCWQVNLARNSKLELKF